MCAPWGHDVPCTRCLELRPFVPDSEPAEELDIYATADDSVEVHFYVPARTPDDVDEVEMGDDGWPGQLDRKLYTRLWPTTLVPLDARRSHLRQRVDELLSDRRPRVLHEASLFHVFGGQEVTTTLREALEHASRELLSGPVRIIVREPVEYRCSCASPTARRRPSCELLSKVGVRAPRYCYPHCLLGKTVVSKEGYERLPKEQQEQAVTEEERDEAISKEDNLRDLCYNAYLPTPAGCEGSDRRSLVVDLQRRLYRGRAIEPLSRSQH